MNTVNERLKWARKQAGFSSAREAAEAVGEKKPTYSGHENGNRGFGQAKAAKYARRYHVSLDWLLTGRGKPRPDDNAPPPGPMEETNDELLRPRRPTVRVVGYAGAGGEIHYYVLPEASLDEVEAPIGATDRTLAIEIRGQSLGGIFDRWYAFFDDVRAPVTPDLIGHLCIVGLPDDRVLIKKLIGGRHEGVYRLISEREDPIEDVPVAWAARVTQMMPR